MSDTCFYHGYIQSQKNDNSSRFVYTNQTADTNTLYISHQRASYLCGSAGIHTLDRPCVSNCRSSEMSTETNRRRTGRFDPTCLRRGSSPSCHVKLLCRILSICPAGVQTTAPLLLCFQLTRSRGKMSSASKSALFPLNELTNGSVSAPPPPLLLFSRLYKCGLHANVSLHRPWLDFVQPELFFFYGACARAQVLTRV